MIEGEVFLNIKEGVEFPDPISGSYNISKHISGMLLGFSKHSDIIIQQSSNDADSQSRYHHIFNQVSGNILLLGLGSGVTQMILADIPEVTKITTVDRNLGAINLYKKGNYPNSDKITYRHEDAYQVKGHYDYIIFDLLAFANPHDKVKVLKATSSNNVLYPDWSDWPGATNNEPPIPVRPWPRAFNPDDPALIDTKARIKALNIKLDA